MKIVLFVIISCTCMVLLFSVYLFTVLICCSALFCHVSQYLIYIDISLLAGFFYIYIHVVQSVNKINAIDCIIEQHLYLLSDFEFLNISPLSASSHLMFLSSRMATLMQLIR
jgi:hypothetical protein